MMKMNMQIFLQTFVHPTIRRALLYVKNVQCDSENPIEDEELASMPGGNTALSRPFQPRRHASTEPEHMGTTPSMILGTDHAWRISLMVPDGGSRR